MLNWFRGRDNTGPGTRGFVRAICAAGLVIARDAASLPPMSIDPTALDAPDLPGLLAQIDDEGLAVPCGTATLIPWDSLYDLLESGRYPDCRASLRVPDDVQCVPVLRSHGSLTDRHFAIVIDGWRSPQGENLASPEVCGAFVRFDETSGLFARPVWTLMSHLSRFRARPDAERDDVSQRRQWGCIRRLAIAAGARLDGFLFRSVVLTPEKLDIDLRASEGGGARVVEVMPGFEGAPTDWLAHFDRHRSVQDLYNIPTPDGVVQVLISPHVKTVLSSIKRMPCRRVAGTRAEAFLVNPYAALGEAACETIDETQFMTARAYADLLFETFVAEIKRDAVGYPEAVGLRIETPVGDGQVGSEVHWFTDDDELEKFVRTVGASLEQGHQLCGWQGYDFELRGETPLELALLKQALDERRKPRTLVSYAAIHDLERYAERVEGVGEEKRYYSPFIAKKDDSDGWFPDNIVPVIAWMPEGETEPVAVPITPEVKEQLRAKVEEAKDRGQDTITVGGLDRPMPVGEAEFILDTFDRAEEAARTGTLDPARPPSGAGARPRKHLVIKANIQSIDYEETQRDILLNGPSEPTLPSGLRDTVILKDHQRSGIAWLQHLFGKAPHHCRGAVLADDMGLGKTLQLLTLLASCFERDSSLSPALVVAPVSLLENWEEEAGKFLRDGVLSILTAYGDSLAKLRVSREQIDAQLLADGLVKFLRPGWRGNANVVLTTYETLRDFEFSFAAEKWSIMVCDEAQRIKNPNALVTRAAKKQNVTFKIACTGTPVENTLADLWCLFDYIQPGLLGALNDFGRRYRRPIEAETEEERARVHELRERIAPQILRRTKSEVAKDLMPKTPVPSRVPLSLHQRSLYGHALELFKQRHEPGFVSPFKNHLGLLHYLRLICTDPRRIGLNVFRPEPLADYRTRAPKLAWLLETLSGIKTKKEKAIIFCEFREIQRMLRHYVEEVFGIAPDIINGDTAASAKQTASRQKRIKAFQAQPGFGVIILSPVAVGFGVNIQEANHVIHYTRTWNPAKEDQATDRAYRIGQRREVYVYCPIVEADDFTTFDVKLDQLLENKRSLAADMLNGSGDVGPGDFAIEDVVPGAGTRPLSEDITLDVMLSMEWDYFECFVASLWRKQGYPRVYRTPKHDDGVDVVAIDGSSGVLIQCKSCRSEDATLGWDAVKDVVAGEAAYEERHPGVTFRKACVTNQYFNDTAKFHAGLNDVELLDQDSLVELLARFPVTTLDLEKLLYAEW